MIKNLPTQCKRHKRHGFDPWFRKIPWKRKWQPTPVFLPGKSHGQGFLAFPNQEKFRQGFIGAPAVAGERENMQQACLLALKRGKLVPHSG